MKSRLSLGLALLVCLKCEIPKLVERGATYPVHVLPGPTGTLGRGCRFQCQLSYVLWSILNWDTRPQVGTGGTIVAWVLPK